MSVVDVRISGAGVVCWDVPDGEQSSLYSEFRLKVVKTAGQGENIVTVSKNCYDLSMLNLTQGEYSVQVRHCIDAGRSYFVAGCIIFSEANLQFNIRFRSCHKMEHRWGTTLNHKHT